MSMKHELAKFAAICAVLANAVAASAQSVIVLPTAGDDARAEVVAHSATPRPPADAYGAAAAPRSAAVSLAGEKLGADPDANIRLELTRDWWRAR